MNGASICDFKRFAVHDGPGIRTTLFLKGCPLRCIWCHNPESIRMRPELGLLKRKCVLCGDCARICPCHTVTGGTHVINRLMCSSCGKCVQSCLHDALELYGREVTVEEALSLILEDRRFYAASGGGATLSGGEPLLQAAFAAELCDRLRGHGIHTAIDSCGCVDWTAFEAVLPFTELFLYDFKHADSETHRRLTGAGNELIRENLIRLSECGKPIEIRMPLVPGFNTDDAAIRAAGKFLGERSNLVGVRLLAYHALARSKYEAVGHPDTMPDTPPPDGASLHRIAGILRDFGLDVIL